MSDAAVTEVDALRAALESRDAQLSRQNAGLAQMARERDALRADVARLQALADTRWTTCADMSRDVARLQAENDALRAIIESGKAAT